jgi:hypothetical protein
MLHFLIFLFIVGLFIELLWGKNEARHPLDGRCRPRLELLFWGESNRQKGVRDRAGTGIALSARSRSSSSISATSAFAAARSAWRIGRRAAAQSSS